MTAVFYCPNLRAVSNDKPHKQVNTMSYSDKFTLSLNQCRQLTAKGEVLRDWLEQVTNQPQWLEFMGAIDSITEMQAIKQGGCASGAYWPAVTYQTALECMHSHGDVVLDYIDEALGELPAPPKGETWVGMAVFYCSLAVELWVGSFDLDGVDWD